MKPSLNTMLKRIFSIPQSLNGNVFQLPSMQKVPLLYYNACLVFAIIVRRICGKQCSDKLLCYHPC